MRSGFQALPHGCLRKVDYFVDTEYAGTGWLEGQMLYVYNPIVPAEEVVVEAIGFDENDQILSRSRCLMDLTQDQGVYIRQWDEGTYDIGLERADTFIRYIEVRVDGFLLTDIFSGEQQSDWALYISYTFNTFGRRNIEVTAYDGSGNVMGVYERDFTFFDDAQP